MNFHKCVYVLFLGIFFISQGKSQIILENGKVSFKLSDSTEVTLFPTSPKTEIVHKAYYYLPTNLRVSVRDSVPEFSWLTYDSDEDGTLDGGILHLLLTWGLNTKQLEEAETILKSTVDSTALIFGAISLEALPSQSWNIVSKDSSQLDNILLKNVNGNAQIPQTAGNKWAASFMISKDDIDKVNESLKDTSILTKTYIVFNYEYEKIIKKDFIQTSRTVPLQLTASLEQLIGTYLGTLNK